MSKVIGIDLGTTNSCVSVIEGREVVVIANREGSRTTPSVVSILPNGERLIGQVAKRQAARNPMATIYAVKRLMGRSIDDPEIALMQSLVPYEITGMGSNEQSAAGVRIDDRIYSPQEISAMILQYLREIAEEYLGEPVHQAVITVPANFNDSQRQATRDAGRIAGLDVLRVLNEPTAASLGYGFGEDKRETIVVYDLGGGTFDISILRLGDGLYEVLATLGDPFLGGEDFDNALFDCITEEFQNEHQLDLRSDISAYYRLREACEIAKQELSLAKSTELNLPFLMLKDGIPLHLSRSITREELEDLTRHLVERTLPACEQALKDAGLKRTDITQVVLVGGMTRMPLVRKMVEDFFQRSINKEVNPDEVISMGASIQAGVLNGELQELVLMDVTPLTLGIETMGGVFQALIPRNTAIPCEYSEIFSTTVDFQEMVSVHVLQGEREMAADNHSLARFELWGLPPLLRGMPQIEVSFKIDASGIVSVSAQELATKREAKVRIEVSGGLSEADIDAMIAEAEALRENDLYFREMTEMLNAAKGQLYMTQRSFKELSEFLQTTQREEIALEIDELAAYLNQDGVYDFKDLDLVKARLSEIAAEISELAYRSMMGG